MSTFLELCQTTRVECGIAGNASGNTPITTSAQVGELLRVVNWVKQAYEDIQLKHPNWDFLRKTGQFTVTPGIAVYAPSIISDLADWKADSLRVYLTSVQDEQWLPQRPWDLLRDSRLFGANALVQGRPIEFARMPDRSIRVWPTPDQAYIITGEYFSKPNSFSNDGDSPVFDRHHIAIVWNAVMRYAAWTGEPSLYAQAQKEYNRLIDKLEYLYTPRLTMGAALA